MKTSITLSRDDFINQFPPLNLQNKVDVKSIWEDEGFHIYVHIPYCVKKCDFCYYISFECHEKKIPDVYFNALLEEVRIYGMRSEFKNRKVRSIYFGGGTPTVMSLEQIDLLCKTLKSNFNIDDSTELCCEVRPGPETTEEKIMLLKKHGMSRISVGCQSLNDDVLRKNGRNHNSGYFRKTFDMIKKCDIFCTNVDLMSGMVDDTYESFMDTIKELIKMNPESITIYKMELYLNNVLYKKSLQNKWEMISDAEEAKYVSDAYRILIESGYKHSDNYSFVKSSIYEQIHRYGNWLGEDMIGLGLSSHSYYKDHIYQNENRLDDYLSKIRENNLPIRRAYKFSKNEEMRRWVIFAVKKTKMNLISFEKRFGISALSIFEEEFGFLQKEGFIKIEDNILNATDKGILYADDIVRIFYPKQYRNIVLAHKNRKDK